MLPHQNYKRVNISTADPVRITVLLYEGAIQNLNQTLRLFGHDDPAASAKLTRTLEIINYLRNVLDFEKGARSRATWSGFTIICATPWPKPIS